MGHFQIAKGGSIRHANQQRDDGEILAYRFYKPTDAAYYVLKRSDLDYYFRIADYLVDPVRETTRENLVQVRAGK